MTLSGRIADQYRIITSAAGWIDESDRGRLLFEGADALSFLQALLTNDVARLEPGQGAYAAYLTPNGRMIADIEILRRGNAVVGLVAPGAAAGLAARFDQLVFSEDLRVTDASSGSYELRVIGTHAPATIASAFGVSSETLVSLPESWQADAMQNAFVVRTGGSAQPAFRIIGPAGGRADAIDRLTLAGAAPIDADLVDALRVMNGRPAWGRDLGGDVIPLEAGLLERAISTTKGCYVGQEIVIRMLHRGGGRVAKRLVTLALGDPTELPARGTALTTDAGAEVGKVTSVARSPESGQAIALGYVRGEHAEPGAALKLGETGIVATIVGLAG